MRLRKNQREGLLDSIGDSLDALTAKRISLVKVGLVAGGVVALTAGSAAVSALRRRLGESDS
jgi:hypothetical protein